MTEPTIPSHDPSGADEPVGAIPFLIEKRLQSFDDMLPARVVQVNRAANRAEVRPLIQLIRTDGTLVDRDTIASIPIMVAGGGGFMLNFNVQPGDLGWIKASDRDISLFLQGYTAAPPNTEAIHVFSNAVFIPDVMRGFTVAGEDSAAAVLQSLDGSVKISLNNSRIKLTAPQVEIVATTSITGNTTITGTLDVSGNITGAEVYAGDVPLGNHGHEGVTSGGDTSLGPVPL